MKKILATVASLLSTGVMAYGVGNSAQPLPVAKRLLSTEFTGITSDNGGMGAQVRYTQKLNQNFTADAGLGINGGDRGQRIFAGLDYEMYPDYMRQPRVSVKGTFERMEEFEVQRTKISMAPTVSKGMSFWGKEAFPFVSLPTGLNLNTDSQEYDTFVSLNAGVTGAIPLKGYQHLFGNMELQVDLKNSYTGFLMGVTFPMN